MVDRSLCGALAALEVSDVGVLAGEKRPREFTGAERDAATLAAFPNGRRCRVNGLKSDSGKFLNGMYGFVQSWAPAKNPANDNNRDGTVGFEFADDPTKQRWLVYLYPDGSIWEEALSRIQITAQEPQNREPANAAYFALMRMNLESDDWPVESLGDLIASNLDKKSVEYETVEAEAWRITEDEEGVDDADVAQRIDEANKERTISTFAKLQTDIWEFYFLSDDDDYPGNSYTQPVQTPLEIEQANASLLPTEQPDERVNLAIRIVVDGDAMMQYGMSTEAADHPHGQAPGHGWLLNLDSLLFSAPRSEQEKKDSPQGHYEGEGNLSQWDSVLGVSTWRAEWQTHAHRYNHIQAHPWLLKRCKSWDEPAGIRWIGKFDRTLQGQLRPNITWGRFVKTIEPAPWALLGFANHGTFTQNADIGSEAAFATFTSFLEKNATQFQYLLEFPDVEAYAASLSVADGGTGTTRPGTPSSSSSSSKVL